MKALKLLVALVFAVYSTAFAQTVFISYTGSGSLQDPPEERAPVFGGKTYRSDSDTANPLTTDPSSSNYLTVSAGYMVNDHSLLVVFEHHKVGFNTGRFTFRLPWSPEMTFLTDVSYSFVNGNSTEPTVAFYGLFDRYNGGGFTEIPAIFPSFSLTLSRLEVSYDSIGIPVVNVFSGMFTQVYGNTLDTGLFQFSTGTINYSTTAAIPEPATTALGFCLGALLLLVRRRMSAHKTA